MKRLMQLSAMGLFCAIIALTANAGHAQNLSNAKIKTNISQAKKSDPIVEFIKKRREARAERNAKRKHLQAKRVKQSAKLKSKRKKIVRTKKTRKNNVKRKSLLQILFKPNKKASKAKLVKKARYNPRNGRIKGGSKRYHHIIARHARANGVPLRLAKAVIKIESNFNPNARGGVGEIGLMQLRFATARGVGYRGSKRDLYHPETNIRYGMKYLGKAHRLAGGSLCGTILKYNAGHGAKRMNRISANYCRKVKRVLGHR